MLGEKDIRERIAEIEEAIGKLQAEKQMLQNLIYMRVARSRAAEVKDKRSYKRIYHEEKVKLALTGKVQGMSAKQIYSALLGQGIYLRESTLRSYLTRMRQRGELVHDKGTGRWKLLQREKK